MSLNDSLERYELRDNVSKLLQVVRSMLSSYLKENSDDEKLQLVYDSIFETGWILSDPNKFIDKERS